MDTSWNVCAITGEQLTEPVVSKKSGHIFEKRVILKYIETAGICPITNQSLTKEDLIPIQMNPIIKPRSVNQSSIPNMLQIFQSEWDSLMLETYNLKQHLETVRQELSHALYQHDAACRVIAKLIKERDETRKELANIYEELGQKKEEPTQIVVERQVLPQALKEEIEAMAEKLNKHRKQLKKNTSYFEQFTPIENFVNFTPKEKVSLHSTTKPGITSADIHKNEELIVTGGVDGQVILYNAKDNKIVAQVEAHAKKVTEVLFAHFDNEFRIISTSEDNTLKVFKLNEEKAELEEVYAFKEHTKQIIGAAVHPIGYMLIAASRDGTFSFHDLRDAKHILTVAEYSSTMVFTSIKIHPDGHFIALGTQEGSIIIWQIADNSLVSILKTEDQNHGEISYLSFSENGYILAAGSKSEGQIRIWDLRHSNCIAKLFQDDVANLGAVNFDFSTAVLAVSDGNLLKIYDTKNWKLQTQIQAHTDLITAIKFQQFSKFIVTCSMDRHLAIYNV